MTEQQPKTTQIIDIVEMQPTQNGSQTPDTAQIEDILSPLYWFFFYDTGKQIVYDVRHVAQGFPLIQM
jgi:hypothetical protein